MGREKADREKAHKERSAAAPPEPSQLAHTKTCRRCEKEKTSLEFHRNPDKRDGLAPHCKECVNEARRKRTARENRREESDTTVLNIKALKTEIKYEESGTLDLGVFESLLRNFINGSLSDEDEEGKTG